MIAVDSDFKPFEDIVKASKTADEAFKKVRDIQGISPEVATAFREEYDPTGELTPQQAFEKFYDDVKQTKEAPPVSKQGTADMGGVKPADVSTPKTEIQVKRQAIKDRIAEKFKAQRGQLSSGFDPTLLKDFIELGATYIEEGIGNCRCVY